MDRRAAVASLAALVALALAAPALARYEPVLREDVPGIVKRKARVHVAYPCKSVYRLDGDHTSGERFLPGDSFRVVSAYRRHPRAKPDPRMVVARTRDGRTYRVNVKCLSSRRPDYSYRGKKPFRVFYRSLLRDTPRLLEAWAALVRKHNHHIPISNPETRASNPDWWRAKAYLEHLKWVKGQFWNMGYSGRTERSVLKREKDWILRRGEPFIRGFAGDGPPELKKRFKQIVRLLQQGSRARTASSRIWRTQRKIAQESQSDRYKGLSPEHRTRLLSEDLAELHAELGKWQTRFNTAVTGLRTGLIGLGIPVR